MSSVFLTNKSSRTVIVCLTIALDHLKVHDVGPVAAVGVSFSGVRLFLVSKALKSIRSASSSFFQPFAVILNSLQADSKVLTAAFVGAMSMPFCESGPSTVLKRLLTAMNDNKLPGARAGAPKRPPPPPGPRPPRCGPPNVATSYQVRLQRSRHQRSSSSLESRRAGRA